MVRTTIKQKVSLILLSILFFLILLECGLRIGGFAALSIQEYGNKVTSDANDAYRILCLGESTTAEIMDLGDSWPSQLEKILNEKTSKKFKIFNEGVPGTDTTRILRKLEEDVDKYRPHMVITMMGINDPCEIKASYKNNPGILGFLFKKSKVLKLGELLWLYQNNPDEVNVSDSASTIDTGKVTKNEFIELGLYYKDQKKFEEAEEMFKKALEINPNDNWVYIELGRYYYELYKHYNQTTLGKAEEMFKKALEINPIQGTSYRNTIYGELGLIYYDKNELGKAEEMFKKALEINPNNKGVRMLLGNLYYEQGGRLKEVEEIFKDAIKINPNDDWAYSWLGRYYQEQGRSVESKEMFKKGGELRMEYVSLVTKRNYQELYRVLDERKIRLMVMQYPLRDVNELKAMFEGNEDIIFVDNEKNFKKALKTGEYEDYFSDNFAGDFGHCTEKGNKLIAENVANIILKELKI